MKTRTAKKRDRHTGYADLPWDGNIAIVRLRRGDSAWNPVCTSCSLYGPAVIQYRRFSDGGIHATILEGNDGHAR